MNWITISSEADIAQLKTSSFNQPQVIFKHSTRCSISSMAKNRLDRSETPTGIDFHYLDLVAHRNVSNYIAETFGVNHESPQILVIKNGECIFDESHNGIRMDDIIELVSA
jgi:bacillithiol system protein YtxJ